MFRTELTETERTAIVNSGIPPEYLKVIQKFATKHNIVIVLREVKRSARPLRLGPRLGTMPHDILCKTGDIKGIKTDGVDGHLDLLASDPETLALSFSNINFERQRAVHDTTIHGGDDTRLPLFIGNTLYTKPTSTYITLAEGLMRTSAESRAGKPFLGSVTITFGGKSYRYLRFISVDKTRIFHLRPSTEKADRYYKALEDSLHLPTDSGMQFSGNLCSDLHEYQFDPDLKKFIRFCNHFQTLEKSDAPLMAHIVLLPAGTIVSNHEELRPPQIGQKYQLTLCSYQGKRYIYTADLDTLAIFPSKRRFDAQRAYHSRLVHFGTHCQPGEISGVGPQSDHDVLHALNKRIRGEVERAPSVFCHHASVHFPPDTSPASRVLVVRPGSRRGEQFVFCQSGQEFVRQVRRLAAEGFMIPYKNSWPEAERLAAEFPTAIRLTTPENCRVEAPARAEAAAANPMQVDVARAIASFGVLPSPQNMELRRNSSAPALTGHMVAPPPAHDKTSSTDDSTETAVAMDRDAWYRQEVDTIRREIAILSSQLELLKFRERLRLVQTEIASTHTELLVRHGAQQLSSTTSRLSSRL